VTGLRQDEQRVVSRAAGGTNAANVGLQLVAVANLLEIEQDLHFSSHVGKLMESAWHWILLEIDAAVADSLHDAYHLQVAKQQYAI